MQTTIFPIPSLKRVLSFTNTHVISECTIRDLLHAKIKNWEHNRPPDLVRCRSIAENIYTRRPVLDWLLYMIYDKTTNTFYIVDGIHRFTALKIIHEENRRPSDFICPNFFGSNSDATWLYDMHVLVSIKSNPTKGETIDWFQTLNNSNPVPELYIENTAEEKRKVIEDVVKEWTTRFVSHFVASQKPHTPNTNRDRFIDLIDGIYKKYEMEPKTAHNNINEKLYELNHYLRTNIPKKTTPIALEKCEKTGCFLFLLSKDIILDRL